MPVPLCRLAHCLHADYFLRGSTYRQINEGKPTTRSYAGNAVVHLRVVVQESRIHKSLSRRSDRMLHSRVARTVSSVAIELVSRFAGPTPHESTDLDTEHENKMRSRRVRVHCSRTNAPISVTILKHPLYILHRCYLNQYESAC